ncbi:bifunctional 4-hydroxy-2-oxoglutarate aldolase/2-dehydro-3-deoxy-phosphogluconate aldolase [Candidatus Gracilibacteria bacterium]|nr:bifunctional 4-hydroxy-2-oxoglutarate aldolase/2-dehydro-3-deoxy-phosphogluconate aldolase [Candidatus Gracilibacteria bacterium]NJM90329.1 bifunctional 4-hydroxy-2-oxoglutarate aldolase/2-dehydro-3-deoxy-phosphogluconate aldolase [Hydrococcus sp. RU_2_2]NJP20517.1 bifunctional 4-hydroxy-2-oxoglutarate aldolase/2-dehydro-3-deoxy-phosphogluconate aldolase [Hydrococcus sp. CRU_1_1]NJQ97327.1 bifunctional 4-hydroxy-2-oxoglutarate aldolase/2-dehydro-3-deoxy-phosphogluconate aldolase [Hydrococcus 
MSVSNSLNSWLQLLQQYRAIAIIRSPQIELGYSMAKAVARGGMRLVEITWNSDRAPELISQLRSQLPNCTIGTGTILTVDQLKDAISCGIQFCFTPHVKPKIIETAIAFDIPIVAGALTPTEIVTAWQAGASCVKVFPVDAVGGVSYIKSLQGPLKEVPLIPTGGVTLDDTSQYIAAGAIAVGLAGQLFPKHLLEARNWDAIAHQAKMLQQQLFKEM